MREGAGCGSGDVDVDVSEDEDEDEDEDGGDSGRTSMDDGRRFSVVLSPPLMRIR
jgi:hypothetical protein